jgi:hypothetical protein
MGHELGRCLALPACEHGDAGEEILIGECVRGRGSVHLHVPCVSRRISRSGRAPGTADARRRTDRSARAMTSAREAAWRRTFNHTRVVKRASRQDSFRAARTRVRKFDVPKKTGERDAESQARLPCEHLSAVAGLVAMAGERVLLSLPFLQQPASPEWRPPQGLGGHRSFLGADRGYDTGGRVAAMREQGVTSGILRTSGDGAFRRPHTPPHRMPGWPSRAEPHGARCVTTVFWGRTISACE